MRKSFTVFLVLAFVLSLSLPALAGSEKGDKVKLTGWITDEWCGAKNANADGAGCAKACAKKGAKLVLFSDGKVYKLSDQETALQHVGHKVLVTGILADEESVTVSKIEKVKEKA